MADHADRRRPTKAATADRKKRKLASSVGRGGAFGTAHKVLDRGDASKAQLLRNKRSMGVKLSAADEQFLLRFAQSTDSHQ